MSPQIGSEGGSKEEEVDDKNVKRIDRLEEVVCKLAEEITKMSECISKLADIQDLDKSKRYITLWRDLGGNNFNYNPDGAMHPMTYLKRLTNMFKNAGVPESAKVSLAITTLRGSASDWGIAKEDAFTNFDSFVTAFKNRYWGLEQERKLFSKIKLGTYQSGTRVDHFLKMAGKASFLTEKIPEDMLVEYLAGHFPADIKRGILIAKITTIDEAESFLSKLDNA